MQSTSAEYKQLIRKTGRSFHLKADVVLADEQQTRLALNEDDIWLGSFSIEEATSQSGEFSIGSAVVGEMKLALNNRDGRFDSYDFNQAAFKPFVGLETSLGTEWIAKGVFIVDSPVSYGKTIDITALDRMAELDKPYSLSSLHYPATLGQIAADVCSTCNLTLATPRFFHSDYEVAVRPEDDKLTCREILSYAAQLAGCYAKANAAGDIQLDWYDFSAFEEASLTTPVTLDIFQSFTMATQDITLTGIQIIPQEEEQQSYFYGEEGYVVTIEDNPLAQQGLDALTRSLGEKLCGLTFRPFEAEHLSDPSIEAGDVCLIVDREGITHRAFVSSIGYSFGTFQTAVCDADTPTQKETTRYSIYSKAVAASRENTFHQLTNYDREVRRLNELMANSMGFYQTKQNLEDGSTIQYMHDAPELENSRVIWKKTIDGFAVSTDGGETYTVGVTKDGNAVFQILSAVGISADSIDGRFIKIGSVTEDAISDEYRLALEQAIGDKANQVEQRVTASFENTLKDFTFRFENGYQGGVNYITNSSGLSESYDDWKTEGDQARLSSILGDATNDLSEHVIANSAFSISTGSFSQSVRVMQNCDYSLTFKAKKGAELGIAKVMIGAEELIVFNDIEEHDWEEYFLTFQSADASEVTVSFSYAGEGMLVGDIMLAEGTQRHLWTPAPNEIYTNEVKIDKRGINIRNMESETNTLITNRKFAVRYGEEDVISVERDTSHLKNTEVDGNMRIGKLKFSRLSDSNAMNLVLLD